jgi:hypothetical protein
MGQQAASTTAHKFELRAGVGLLTVPEIGTTIAAAVSASLVPVGYSDIKVTSTLPAIPVSFLIHPDNRFSYGADIIFNGMSSDFSYTNGTKSSVKSNFFTILLRGDLHYINKQGFKVYGSLAAGPSFFKSTGSTGTSSSTRLGYQVTPIGLSFGNSFMGWAELGFGYRGILSAGLAYRF